MGRARVKIWGSIGLLWACALLPWLRLRSFIWEEGTNAVLARDIVARGDWLHPLLHDVTFIEKPSLLPWLIAAVAKIGGGVTELTARLPAMLAVLFTAFMVRALTRRHASLPASVFAALCFMFCPLLLQKLTIAEPDTLITALSFAAFLLWWDGAAKGSPSLWRWVGSGALLAVLAMAKGPQPVGFFALGVGLYLVVQRRWRELPGLVLCLLIPLAATLAWAISVYRPGGETTWLQYSRLEKLPTLIGYLGHNARTIGQLALELLPGLMLLPFLPAMGKRQAADTPAVMLPLICYAGACTAVLLLWPFALSRYAMPIAPAIAVLAGFAWDRLGATREVWLRNVATGVVAALAIYQLVLANIIVPLYAERFGSARTDGEKIAAAVQAEAVPIYCEDPSNSDQLFYARLEVHCFHNEQYYAIVAPAWLLASQADLDQLAQHRPDLDIRNVLKTRAGFEVVTAYLTPRPGKQNP
ncbi:MAG: ArnT family glycosyltransferase [Xanthobacteraceae bacterium]